MNLLISGGGLDSCAATLLLKPEIIFHVNYGQVMSSQELNAIKVQAQCVGSTVIPLECQLAAHVFLKRTNPSSMLLGLGDEPFIKGRNLFIAQTVISYVLGSSIKAEEVLFALCKENMMFSDADPQFMGYLDEVMFRSYGIHVRAPYITVPKIDFMRSAYCLNNDFFDMSFTCWTPNGNEECGVCYHCEKKNKLKQEIVG